MYTIFTNKCEDTTVEIWHFTLTFVAPVSRYHSIDAVLSTRNIAGFDIFEYVYIY